MVVWTGWVNTPVKNIKIFWVNVFFKFPSAKLTMCKTVTNNLVGWFNNKPSMFTNLTFNNPQ